jgi:RND family efflux transporter MFP subunit
MKAFITRRPAVVIILLAVVVAGILIASRERSTALTRPERAWAVDVATAARQTLKPTLELFGSVKSPQDAELSSGVDGLITDVPVLDGETVEKGHVLLLIDDRDVRLTLQQADADLLEVKAKRSFAEQRLERERQALEKQAELLTLTETRSDRAEELREQGLLSQSDLDTSDENLKRQQLAVNQAQLLVEEVEIQLTEFSAQISRAEALREQASINLDRTRVQAPFDGVVSDLTVSQGDRVRADDVLMRLQNPASIEVRTQIPARYAEQVSNGLAAGQTMKAMVQIGAQSVTGELTRISGQTSEASGGVDGFVRFGTSPRGLRLGSTVRILLELPPQENVIAVPAEALYGRNQLYKLVDKRMQMVEVERIGERVQLIGGTEVLVRSASLNETDQIVITKLSNAADGLLTEPTRSGGPGMVGQRDDAAIDGGT